MQLIVWKFVFPCPEYNIRERKSTVYQQGTEAMQNRELRLIEAHSTEDKQMDNKEYEL